MFPYKDNDECIFISRQKFAVQFQRQFLFVTNSLISQTLL